MTSKQSVIVGVCAIIFGLLSGMAIVGGSVDRKIADAKGDFGEATEAFVSEQQGAMGAFEDRIAAIELQVSEAAEAADALAGSLGGQMSEMEEALLAEIHEATNSAEERVAALRASLKAPSADIHKRVGETAIVADGAVRVFVSRLDPDTGTARLNINGDTTTLATGGSTTVGTESGDCSVTVVSVDTDGAGLAVSCGATAADIPPAPTEGFRAGEVARFDDGALSVFVSGLAEDGSAARLAINGVVTETVTSGDTVEVASGDVNCSVTVTGVGNGVVGLDGSCN